MYADEYGGYGTGMNSNYRNGGGGGNNVNSGSRFSGGNDRGGLYKFFSTFKKC